MADYGGDMRCLRNYVTPHNAQVDDA